MRRRVPLTGAFVTRIVRDGVQQRSVRHKRLLPAWERKGNPLRPRPRAPWRGPRRDTGRPPGERMGHTVRPLDECAHHTVRPLAMLSNGKHAKAVCLPERKRAKSRIYTIPLSQPVAAPSAARSDAPCRSAASVAACRHHPVIHFPLLLHRQHPDLPLPQIRSQHPCVQLCMQFRCCTPCRYHPDMQPFRCNIVGITRPVCTESPPISCLSAG